VHCVLFFYTDLQQCEQTSDVAPRQVRSAYCRPHKLCPVEDCGASVVHVPRHLRECHGWMAADARNAVKSYRLHKMHTHINHRHPKYKDYHKARCCPVEGCGAVVKRLSSHLKHHKIPQHSALYKELLTAAKKGSRSVRIPSARCGNTFISTTAVRSQDEAATCSQNDNICDADCSDDDVEPAEQHNRTESKSVRSDDVNSLAACDNRSSTVVSTRDVAASSYMDCSDDDAEPMNVEEWHDGDVKDTEAEKDVKEFYAWMTSADGGRKHVKSATQRASQMAKLITLTQQNNITLWDRSLLAVFSKYATEKQYLPATKKAYLNSLKHFCDFAMCESKADDKLISKTKERVCFWIASYRKECGKRQQQRMDTDLAKLITPEQLAQFRRSEQALSAVKLIARCGSGPLSVVQGEYVNLRDFLLTEISFANANRSGVLANMTVKEFQEARKVDGQYVVSVAEHKTSVTYGAAKIVLSPTLHHYVTVYCKDIRPQVLSSQNSANELFLSWCGAGMNSGQITKSVQRVWSKAGLGEGITLNIVRKTAVSLVHQAQPKMTASLADLMGHRQSTAQKCYRLIEREKSSVVASQTLTKILAGERSVRELKEMDDEAAAAGPATLTQGLTAAAGPTSDLPQRMMWTEEQLHALHSVFGEEIKANNICLSSVREKVKQNTVLTSIDCRKVYDRLRSEMRQQLSDCEMTLPVDEDTAYDLVSRLLKPHDACEDISESDCIAPSSKSSLKDLFTRKDTDVILKLCAHIIGGGAVSDKRIEDTLQQSAAGRNLLSNFSLFQLKNRVKYERRKKHSITRKCIH